ncbi:MAG: hypothetical protein ABIA93_03400 [Candidatus Woesearchaeota archaeon]
MSYASEKEEGEVFSSLSDEEQRRYCDRLRENGGRVRDALDQTVGKVWFDEDVAPKGSRFRTGRSHRSRR